MRTKRLPKQPNTKAPDGSEVRFLLKGIRGDLSPFSLPVEATSTAIAHKTIEETWYFISGRGQFWRKEGDMKQILEVGSGVSLDIPPGAHFQFRNTGKRPPRFLMATMLLWPGDNEAFPVQGPWKPSEVG